ncbi:MAG: DUF3417 domain-containing protein, partial [Bacteroidales bacterium]
RTFQDQGHQDKLDAATIYSMFENKIVPLYFAKNSKGYSPEWIQYIKNSIAKIAPDFTMNRMINDYINRFYIKEAKRNTLLKTDNYKLAKEIAAWKIMIAEKWDKIEIIDVNLPEEFVTGPQIGAVYPIEVTIDRKGLPNCFGVEIVVTIEGDEQKAASLVHELEIVKTDGDLTTYRYDYQVSRAGIYKYAFRLFPKNSLLPHRQDFAYVKWFLTGKNKK